MKRVLVHLIAVACAGLAGVGIWCLCAEGPHLLILPFHFFANSWEDRIGASVDRKSFGIFVAADLRLSEQEQWRLIRAHGSLFHTHQALGFVAIYGESYWIERVIGPNSTDPDHGMAWVWAIGAGVPSALGFPLMIGFPIWIWGKALRRRVVMRRRKRNGLCVGCGYDLRASPERCPECGRIARRAEPA